MNFPVVFYNISTSYLRRDVKNKNNPNLVKARKLKEDEEFRLNGISINGKVGQYVVWIPSTFELKIVDADKFEHLYSEIRL